MRLYHSFRSHVNNEAEQLCPCGFINQKEADSESLHIVEFKTLPLKQIDCSFQNIDPLAKSRADAVSKEFENDCSVDLECSALQDDCPSDCCGRSNSMLRNWGNLTHVASDNESISTKTRFRQKFEKCNLLEKEEHQEYLTCNNSELFEEVNRPDTFHLNEKDTTQTSKHPLCYGYETFPKENTQNSEACKSINLKDNTLEKINSSVTTKRENKSDRSVLTLRSSTELPNMSCLAKFPDLPSNKSHNSLDLPKPSSDCHFTGLQSEFTLPKPSYNYFKQKTTLNNNQPKQRHVSFITEPARSEIHHDTPGSVVVSHNAPVSSECCPESSVSSSGDPFALVSSWHRNGNTPRPQSLTPPGPKMSARAGSIDSLLLKKPSPLFKNPTPPIESKPDSACGHANAGQEICYLCHQRNRRNVPVSFTEERKRREEEEDRLLQQYQHMKDTESIINEHVCIDTPHNTNQWIRDIESVFSYLVHMICYNIVKLYEGPKKNTIS